ncbi:MAG TPA: hydroxymethylglutaryl-CoA lyase [Rhodospirillaceae bacterium]|nr:hydroxymethylglutaryl-CoA lyase [Rhodospirillaceae bacterium]
MTDTIITERVDIVDVAPRDGFQAVGPWIPTETKVAVVEGLLAAGVRRIETGAFVSPKAVPQMADTAEVHAAVTRPEGARLCALVPNETGVRRALEAGITDLVYVFSVTESHNQGNVRRPVADSLAELERVFELGRDVDGFQLRVNVATAFDCPFEGRVPSAAVLACLDKVTAHGFPMEIGLCDTTGRAFPDQVADLFDRTQRAYDGAGCTWAFHGHDTFGLGVSNALYAYQAGVRVFDAAAAGLGGCPFAPGATGNTASEDLVFTFQNMGVETGIDLERLLAVAEDIAVLPQAATGGHIRTVPRARALADRPAA